MKSINKKLCDAIRNGDLKLVQKCINTGANINIDYGFPLRKSCKLVNEDIIEYLLSKGAHCYEYVLCTAINVGIVDIIKMLLDHDSNCIMNPNVCVSVNQYIYNITPEIDLFEIFLSHGFDANKIIKNAIRGNNIELVNLLLKYGAVISDECLYRSMSNYPMFELLIEHVTINKEHINHCYGTGNNSLDIMRLFLDKGAIITNSNIINCAYSYHNKSVVLGGFIELFSKYGINIRFDNDWLLQFCVSYGLISCCQILLEIDGINANIFDTDNKMKVVISNLLKNDYCQKMKLFLNKHINFYNFMIYSTASLHDNYWIQHYVYNKIDLDKKWMRKFVTDANIEKDYVRIKNQYLTNCVCNDDTKIKHVRFYKSRSDQYYLVFIRITYKCDFFVSEMNWMCIIDRNTGDCIMFIHNNFRDQTKILTYTSKGVASSDVESVITIDEINCAHILNSMLDFADSL